MRGAISKDASIARLTRPWSDAVLIYSTQSTSKILSASARVMPRSWILARVVMSPQPPSSLAMASPSHLSCLADSSPLGTCRAETLQSCLDCMVMPLLLCSIQPATFLCLLLPPRWHQVGA